MIKRLASFFFLGHRSTFLLSNRPIRSVTAARCFRWQ